MKRHRNPPILVAEDLKEVTQADKLRSRAVDMYASDLAQKLRTSIELIHVEDLPLFALDVPFQGYIEEQIEKRAKRIGSRPGRKTKMEAHFVDGPKVENAVTDAAMKFRPELIVVGSHGRKGLRRVYSGSVAEQIVQKSKVPVMVIGPRAQQAFEKALLRAKAPFRSAGRAKILFATDFEPNSRKAQKYAISLAKRLHAELEVFHFLSERFSSATPTTYPAITVPTLDIYLKDIQKKARKKLAAHRAAVQKQKVICSVGLDAKGISSAEAILKEIEKRRPMLVVMGTRGRSLLTDALLGGATRKVLRESSAPVITVHA